MKYKFIGTEQDLIDNGFEVTNWCAYTDDENGLFIDLDASYYEKGIIYHNNGNEDVVQEEIQDLIDEGLVEVVE